MEINDEIVEPSSSESQEVYITLPLLLTNVDRTKENQALHSIYKVDINTLMSISKSLVEGEWSLDDMNHLGMKDGEAELLKGLIQGATHFSEEMSMKEEYIHWDTIALDFDRLTKYSVNNLGLLVDAVPTEYESYKFYSQIPTEEAQLYVRQQLNDTDYIRCQAILNRACKILLFKPKHRVYTLTGVMQQLIPFMKLLSKSTLCQGDEKETLLYNYIGYAMDLIVRSRVTSYWQDDYIKDLQNYKISKDSLISLFAEPDHRIRFKLFVAKLREQFPADVSYEELDAILKSYIVSTEYGKFYNYPPTYFMELNKSKSFWSVSQIVSSQEYRNRIKKDIQESDVPKDVKEKYENVLDKIDIFNT